MTFLDVFVKAIVGHIGLTIWEPAVKELIRCITDCLRLLEPVDLFSLLSPEFISVLNRATVKLIALFAIERAVLIVEDIRGYSLDFSAGLVKSFEVDVSVLLLKVQSGSQAHGCRTATTTIDTLLS